LSCLRVLPMAADRAWPTTPRPLPNEAFGSWLGRVAARYRIGIDDLIATSGVDVDIGEQASSWLAAVPRSDGTIDRLCSISRLSQPDIMRMLTGQRLRTDIFPSCHRCLMLNPWEVESPYWPLGWMAGGAGRCHHPESEVENITPGMLSRARNMTRLIREIERKRYRRLVESSPLNGSIGAASKVRGSD
jgi:hypothetical protein